MTNSKGDELVPALRFPEFTTSWQTKKLAEIGSFKNGINKSGNDFGHGIAFVNLMDVFGKPFLLNADLGLVNASTKEASIYDLKLGDVLFVRSSVKPEGVGETTVLLRDFPNTVYSGFLIRFRAEKPLNLAIGYKKYCFFVESFRRRVLALSTSSANTNINQESLKALKLKFPSIKEQQKIANFLSSVDTKIQQLKRKHSLMQQYKKGVMQQLFSQQLRFKDNNGQDYPDWEVSKFGEVAINKPKKYDPKKDDDDFPCIELDSLSQETGLLLQTYSSKKLASIKNKFNKGDVLFGKLRPYLKKHWLASFQGVCSTEIWVLNGKMLSSEFLFYLIQTHLFQQIANVSSGSKMPRSDWKFISTYPIRYPSKKEEQQKIANFLSAIDQKIQQLNTQITQAETFKKGLLQQMFV